MSTRSNVNVKMSNGEVKSIYVHFDGYGHLPTLIENYNSQELAEKLISLGNLSALDRSIECPNRHSFDSPIKGYCVAYGRDRGESGNEARTYTSFESARFHNNDGDIEYIYEWDGKWTKYYWCRAGFRLDKENEKYV